MNLLHKIKIHEIRSLSGEYFSRFATESDVEVYIKETITGFCIYAISKTENCGVYYAGNLLGEGPCSSAELVIKKFKDVRLAVDVANFLGILNYRLS